MKQGLTNECIIFGEKLIPGPLELEKQNERARWWGRGPPGETSLPGRPEGPGEPGSRLARAAPTNAAARAGERPPALSVRALRPRPSQRSDVRAFPVATSSRGAGRLSGKRCARRRGRAGAPPRSASASTRPAPSALRPAACALAREPSLPPCPCAARVWSCCAARAPGTRPGPARTRDCWGTSVSCRACSVWRSATYRAPPTSSVCKGRSSRTCGRCWRTGCWRYRRTGVPSPVAPVSPAPDITGPPFRDIWSQQQSAGCLGAPDPRGLAFRSDTLASRLPPWRLFPFPNPDSDCQSFGTLTNPLFGLGKRDKRHPSPLASLRVSCFPPPPDPLRRARLENHGLGRPRPAAGSCVCRGVLAGKTVGVARALFRQSGK